jgi:cyclic pyranopterin phosphate synthase
LTPVEPSSPQEPPSENADDRPLTHVDASGRVRMVDVTGKPWTHRRALARCRVTLGSGVVAALISAAEQPSAGQDPVLAELLAAAKVAGIQAAKQTSKLIPLCHTLAVSDVDVSLVFVDGDVEIEGTAEVIGPTGVEMEALTACTFAALSVASAAVLVGEEATIGELTLWEKTGGRSGTWLRDAEVQPASPVR